jgi:hypothetical protein
MSFGAVAIFQGPIQSFRVDVVNPDDISRVIGAHIEHWSWRRTYNFGVLAASQPRSGEATIVQSCCRIRSVAIRPCLHIYYINIFLDLLILQLFNLCVGDEVRILFEVVLGADGAINVGLERGIGESYLTLCRLLSVDNGQKY